VNTSCSSGLLPESFTATIERVGHASFVLKTEQHLPASRIWAFSFFEDPRNLFFITPELLDFRMHGLPASLAVTEGSEFDYRIRWLRIKMPWKSRIVNYRPPEEFTDIQIQGPYRTWLHIHHFDVTKQGTFMTDEVHYCIPFSLLGTLVHTLLIKKQLMDIFCYRAAKIYEWAEQQKDSIP
jgi:ligand-binding SRPBCC domain-containing protein